MVAPAGLICLPDIFCLIYENIINITCTLTPVAYPEGMLGGLSTPLFQFAIFKIS